MINTNDTLGSLATRYPSATAVFLRHRLDFCCRGRDTLSDACRSAGLDPAAIVAEMEAHDADEDQEQPHWDIRPIPELVDHILGRYHEPLRHDLPALIDAARKVERVHRDKPSCPHGLAEHLARARSELEEHMGKEEQVLFPALRSGSHGQAMHMPIRVMMQEHEDHGVSLRRIRELTSDLEAPADACGTWRALYAALGQLEADLMEHIHLENNVLFPRGLNP